jgi:hypothetical protein
VLTNSLKLFQNQIPTALISEKCFSMILGISKNLTRLPVKRFGFETILNRAEASVDFAVNISNTDRHLLDVDEISNLTRFFKKWQEHHLFGKHIDNIWLEYDIGSIEPDFHSPGIIFFEFQEEHLKDRSFFSDYEVFFKDYLDIFGKARLSEGQIRNSFVCFNGMTDKMSLFTIGVPFLRDSISLRLCFLILQKDHVFSFLENIGLKKRSDELKKDLEEYLNNCDFVILHLDINESISEKISLELIVKDISKINYSREKWKKLLSFLAERNMCLQEKSKGLLEWMDESREIFDPELCRYITKRILYHVKVVFQPDAKPYVKGYFGFLQVPIKE